MENFYFELQLFAEEGEGAEQESTFETPEELTGLPEDIVKEVMSEIEQPKEEAPDTEEEDAETDEQVKEDTPTAEADSDNKQYEGIDKPKGRVPYARFQEKVEKVRQLEAELEKLKQEKSVAPTPTPQPTVKTVETPMPNVSTQPSMPQFNRETLEKIESVAHQQAMQMLGWKQEDVDALSYDETGNNANLWQQALRISRDNIHANIRNEFNRQKQEADNFLRQHQALVNEFNNYYAEQAKEADFKDVQAFIGNEFINQVPASEKSIVMDAYERVQKNIASPQDIYCVKNFFERAKTEYRSKHQQVNPAMVADNNTLAQKENKIKQANAFPRSEQVEGTATTEGSPASAETLEKMLATSTWEEIPDNYKKLLLGY